MKSFLLNYLLHATFIAKTVINAFRPLNNHKSQEKTLHLKKILTYLKDRQLEANADNLMSPRVVPTDTQPTKYLADSGMSVSSDTSSILEGTSLINKNKINPAVNIDFIIREDSTVFSSNIHTLQTSCPIRAQKQPPRRASAIGPMVDAIITMMTNASITIMTITLLPRDTTRPRERPVCAHGAILPHG